jgi:hypothetical protein
MWDTDVTNLAVAVTSFALASIILASIAAAILVGLEELLLRVFVQRAVVRSWMAGDKPTKVILSPLHLLRLLWGGVSKGSAWAEAEARLRSLTSIALYSLPQKQLCAQVAEALQLDWIDGAPGEVLRRFTLRYGQLPPGPSTSKAENSGPSVSESIVIAERAIADLESRLERTWSFVHYYGALLIVPAIVAFLRFEREDFFSYEDTLLVAVVFVASLLVPVAHPAIERLRYFRSL